MKITPKVSLVIADDHPVFRKGLNVLLKSTNIFKLISLAEDGTKAIHILQNELHDVVLMDIRMLPMGGLEATEIITKKFPSVKVLALSMDEDENVITQLIKNGAKGYLSKDSDKDEILTAIRVVNEGGNYFSTKVSTILANSIARPKENRLGIAEELEGDRFKDVLYLMCHELSNKEIANSLCLSPRTVEYYRKRTKELTNTRNYVGVMKFAIKSGILDDNLLIQKWKKVVDKNES